jgi:membrane protein involved in colicin uptake
MRKRYLILGLSFVLALALAVPAFGGPTNPISKSLASVKKTANKALKTAKAAQGTANSALSAAQSAQNTADKANTEAGKANTEIKKVQTSVNTAQATADAAKTAAAGAQASANSAKATADAAAAAAAAAEANANTRLKGSTEIFGTTSVSSEANKFSTSECAEGQPTLGGGYELGGSANKVVVTVSEKALYGEGWFVGGQLINGQAGNWTIRAAAICGTK